MLDDLSIFQQLWNWAIETSGGHEYVVYIALAIVAGVAFRVVKPLFDWVAEQIAYMFRFFAERADKRREFRRDNKMPNRT